MIFPIHNTFSPASQQTETSPNLVRDSSASTSQNTSPPRPTVGAPISQNPILPAILDDALTSALHNAPTPPANSANQILTLPAIPPAQIPANQAAASAGVSPSAPSTVGSTGRAGSSGQTNTAATTDMGSSNFNSIASNIESEGGNTATPAIPPKAEAPTPRAHGQIEPLQIEQQSQPTEAHQFAGFVLHVTSLRRHEWWEHGPRCGTRSGFA